MRQSESFFKRLNLHQLSKLCPVYKMDKTNGNITLLPKKVKDLFSRTFLNGYIFSTFLKLTLDRDVFRTLSNIRHWTEMYLEPCLTSKIGLLLKTVHGFKLLAVKYCR